MVLPQQKHLSQGNCCTTSYPSSPSLLPMLTLHLPTPAYASPPTCSDFSLGILLVGWPPPSLWVPPPHTSLNPLSSHLPAVQVSTSIPCSIPQPACNLLWGLAWQSTTQPPQNPLKLAHRPAPALILRGCGCRVNIGEDGCRKMG